MYKLSATRAEKGRNYIPGQPVASDEAESEEDPSGKEREKRSLLGISCSAGY
jgi:hypothetical protein